MKWLVVFLLLTSSAYAEEYATGLVFPENWQDLGEWDNITVTSDLPSHWDWRDFRRLQPIRDQKSCGSCWAFSVTAVTEALHRLIYPMYFPIIDLSEQHLVSRCCGEGSCSGGYFTAFNCVKNDGLPTEADNPYRAANSSCEGGLAVFPSSRITRWAYVGDRTAGASTEQIKQAIYDHGPVSVGVNGGIPNKTGVTTSCGSTNVNHMITIEGWHDDPAYEDNGGGYWLARNSWGSRWANDGYGHIVYTSKSGGKCFAIGSPSAYAVMDGIENLRLHLMGR